MNTSDLQKIKQRYNVVGNCPALNRALDVALQVSILYAVVHNMLMDVPVERISAFENALFDHLTVQHPEILEDIRKTGELRPENEAALRAAIESCRAPFTA